jgi:hypothetical protein
MVYILGHRFHVKDGAINDFRNLLKFAKEWLRFLQKKPELKWIKIGTEKISRKRIAAFPVSGSMTLLSERNELWTSVVEAGTLPSSKIDHSHNFASF